MTFEELQKNYYDEFNGRIVAMRSFEDAFEFDLEFDHWRDPGRVFATMCFRGVAESTVSLGYLGGIGQQDDHPLLWERQEPLDTLYYASSPPNAYELLGRLYDVHHRLFEGYRLPSNYFQTSAKALEAPYGQLASGPRSAVAAYQKVAAPFMRCSLVRGAAREVKGHLLFFDNAYIICEDFTFTDTSIAASGVAR